MADNHSLSHLVTVLENAAQRKRPTAGPPQPAVICTVCRASPSKYMCPRCNTKYCTVVCYKEHNKRCTEEFLGGAVQQSLQSLGSGARGRMQMMEMLQRQAAAADEDQGVADEDQGDSSGNESGSDETPADRLLETVISSLERGEQLSLEDLSKEEQSIIREALKSGELGHLIVPWQPWWLTDPLHASNVSGAPEGEEVSGVQQGPAVVEIKVPAPPLELSNKPLSPSLPIHLAEILFAYCAVLRLYNGEWRDDSEGAATALFDVSAVLGAAATPSSLSEALAHPFQVLCSHTYKDVGGLRWALSLLEDLAAVLRLGKEGGLRALQEVLAILQMAIASSSCLREQPETKGRPKGYKRRLVLAERKVVFFLAWLKELPAAVIKELLELVLVLRASEDERIRSLEVREPIARTPKIEFLPT